MSALSSTPFSRTSRPRSRLAAEATIQTFCEASVQ
jgi:hypothetical protein